MAGSMSSGYSDEEDGAMSAINVTPLVDVTLVLLIVFMITVPGDRRQAAGEGRRAGNDVGQAGAGTDAAHVFPQAER